MIKKIFYKNFILKNIKNCQKKIKIKKENMEKNRYHNMFEEKKPKLKEYQKNIKKQTSLNIINEIVF